jgi:hypothetical protein
MLMAMNQGNLSCGLHHHAKATPPDSGGLVSLA